MYLVTSSRFSVRLALAVCHGIYHAMLSRHAGRLLFVASWREISLGGRYSLISFPNNFLVSSILRLTRDRLSNGKQRLQHKCPKHLQHRLKLRRTHSSLIATEPRDSWRACVADWRELIPSGVATRQGYLQACNAIVPRTKNVQAAGRPHIYNPDKD